jgi:hypothetical protein
MPSRDIAVHVIDPSPLYTGPNRYDRYLRSCINLYRHIHAPLPHNITITINKTPHNVRDNEFTLTISSPNATDNELYDFIRELCNELAADDMIEPISHQPGGRRRRTRRRRTSRRSCRSLARRRSK